MAADERKIDKMGKKEFERRAVANQKAYGSAANTAADWGTVTPSVLGRFVATITAAGGAVRLGYSSDGGAYAVTLYVKADALKYYFPPTEDMDQILQEMTDDYIK